MPPIFEFIPQKGQKIGPPSRLGIPVTGEGSPYLGYYLAALPSYPPGVEDVANQYGEFNFAGDPGTGSKIYYRLTFWLPKYQFNVVKIDEWINVSSTHAEYYQRTLAQKRELEGIVKSGLASAASAVADFELVNHDLRKYKEIMDYFAEKDEHSLKAMFIDRVDVHTDIPNQPIAMRSIVGRWPTIISDFMQLTDEDTDPTKVRKKYEISQAEAVILVTKNKLYMEWRKLFLGAATQRYERLKGLVGARRKSISEYKEWLKPYIAKYKILKEKHEIKGVKGEILSPLSWYEATGQRTFSNNIRLLAWKPFFVGEARALPRVKKSEFIFDPYDDYIREYLILNNKTGLANIYPWLLNKRSDGKKDEKYKFEADLIAEEIKTEWKAKMHNLDPNRLYYMMVDFDIMRLGLALPIGELEDITFYFKMCILSQNILLVKLIELKCRERELERYIEEILGIREKDLPVAEVVKKEYPELFGEKPKKPSEYEKFKGEWKKVGKEFGGYFKMLSRVLRLKPEHRAHFIKPGRYEVDWRERITKQYLVATGQHFKKVKAFLQEEFGVD